MRAWGYLDKAGRFVIGPTYSEAWDFSDGLAGVGNGYGAFFYIDRSGKKVLQLKGGRWEFSDGLTVAGEYGKRIYVDRMGRTVAQFEVETQ
jgi:hypothetical protein